MNKTLLVAFNKLRVALGFAEIAENATEISLDQDFMDKAQAAIDSSAFLKTQVDKLTGDLETAINAKETAEGLLATEKTAHVTTAESLTAATAEIAELKKAKAGITVSIQDKKDKIEGENKNEFETSYDREKREMLEKEKI